MNRNPAINFPEQWDRVQLKRLFKVVTGATPKSSEESYWDGDIDWVTPGDISDLSGGRVESTRRQLTKKGYNNCGAEVVKAGSIVFTKRAPIGEVAILGIDACSNQGCLLLEPIRDVDTRFYFRLLQTQKDYLNSLGSGSTFMEIGTDDLRSLIVPHPPLPVQRRICDSLEKRLEKLGHLVKVKKKLTKHLDEKRRSLIAQAVTRALDEGPMQDSGYPWLGEVPAHWNVERLKFHLHDIEQGWSPSCYSYPAPEDKWGVLKVGAVNDWIFDPSENKQLPEDTEPRPELEIEEGDILMSRANTTELLGSVSIVQSTRDKLLLCDKLYRLDLKDDRFDPEFLVRFLRSDPGRFEFERAATGTSGSMQNITQGTVQNVWVVRPPLGEQHDIVEFINERAEQINSVHEGTQKTIDLLEERRRSLITAAVTGQLNVGVPA